VSVGSKLALLVFGLFSIGSFLIILFMIWLHLHMGMELASLIAISSPLFAAGFGGALFIWGKLRESLRKGLDSVNENALRSLWGASNPNMDPYRLSAKGIEKIRDYLRRYARFLGVIPLHPIEWKRIDRFISLLEPFEKNLKKIEELAMKEMGRWVGREQILIRLGFDFKISPSMSSPEQEKRLMMVVPKLLNEQAKLIDDTKQLVIDLEKIKKEIRENLDNFLKENHLSILVHWRTP